MVPSGSYNKEEGFEFEYTEFSNVYAGEESRAEGHCSAVLNQAAYSSDFIQPEASSCGSRLFSPTSTFHTYAFK